MEVSQRLQPIQQKACQLFTEVESQGTELEQVVITAEQCLEGIINDAMIQEFTKKEAITLQQVKVAQAKIKEFEAQFIRLE